MDKNRFSIVIPAYNEESRIVHTIREVARTFDRISPSGYEIIVVDDCSTDGTLSRLNELKKIYPQLIVVRNKKNFGKGRALKYALRFCSYEYIVWLDADLDIHPLGVEVLFDIMQMDNADIAIGSKMHPNSVVDYPFKRRIVSYGYYIFIRILFDLPCHDTQTGLKIFKREALEKVFKRVLVKKFAFDLEVLVNAHRLGYKITEGPIILNHKSKYHGIGLRSVFTTAWDTLAVFWRVYFLRYYDHIDYYRRKNMAKEFRRVRR